MLTERDRGGDMPLPRLLAVTCFIAIAWQNVLGLNLIIWFIFKKWSGLYFWMVLIASWGIFLHELGFFMMFFGFAKSWGRAFAMIWCGWVCMVTGQSLVLWSRLHLVVRNTRRLRWVLYVIITNGIVFHITSAVLMVLAHNETRLAKIFPIFENFGVTVFGLQEITISIMYIFETSKFVRSSADFRGRNKSTMVNVLMANVFIVMLDIAVICTQCANLFQVQVAFKGAVYSIKLGIEFFILNQLVEAVGLDARSGVNFASGSATTGAKSKVTYNENVATDNVELDTLANPGNKLAHMGSGTRHSVGVASRPISTPPHADQIRVTKTLETRIHDKGAQNGNGVTTWSDKGRTSAASSEVEFAKRGY